MKRLQKIASLSLSAFGLGSAMTLLLAGPAAADDFSGLLRGQYANVSGSHLNASDWGIQGSGALSLGGSGFNAQVDGSYNNATSNGTNTSIGSVSGLLYYRAPEGQIGGLVDYTEASGSGSGHVIPYGVFGDYYFSNQITAGLEGGGLSAPGTSGGFVEGHLIGYVMPDFSIKGFDTYISVTGGQNNTAGVEAEYLLSETVPISIYGGYANLNFSRNGVPGSTSFNTFGIGLKFYINGDGKPLVDDQRNGVVDTSTLVSAVRYAF